MNSRIDSEAGLEAMEAREEQHSLLGAKKSTWNPGTLLVYSTTECLSDCQIIHFNIRLAFSSFLWC